MQGKWWWRVGGTGRVAVLALTLVKEGSPSVPDAPCVLLCNAFRAAGTKQWGKQMHMSV